MSEATPSALLTELKRMAESGEVDDKILPRLLLASHIDLLEKFGKFSGHTHSEYATLVAHNALQDEVKAWKNRAIGIGIGATLGGAGLATAILKIFIP